MWEQLSSYPLHGLVNSAGFGVYGEVMLQEPARVQELLRLNIGALFYLSQAFASAYADTSGAQLINVSSAGGYTLVPGAAVYCASKFCVSAFTEALDRELRAQGHPLRAKVLAPAATETEFGAIASGRPDYDYDVAFPVRHQADQMAQYLLDLYDSDAPVGLVDRCTFSFALRDYMLPTA